MIDFFKSVGAGFENIFSYIASTIETMRRADHAISSFVLGCASVINILPSPWPALIWCALALLLAFIVFEILRDFL